MKATIQVGPIGVKYKNRYSLAFTANPLRLLAKKVLSMDNTITVILGIVAILLPLVVGRLFWKRFDHYFGRGDEAYMDTLEYFLKKIGSTVLVAFVILWIGISLVFNGSAS